MNTARDVMKQALVEYLTVRKCFYDRPKKEGVEEYVAIRYRDHDSAFRAHKVEWLLPRVRAAQELLDAMREEEQL